MSKTPWSVYHDGILWAISCVDVNVEGDYLQRCPPGVRQSTFVCRNVSVTDLCTNNGNINLIGKDYDPKDPTGT